MGTITLGDGRKITVGEEFTRLSPAEQQEWVNEVAVKFPAASATPAATAPAPAPASDDHGLARRQKMTQAEAAVSPFTEWPGHTRQISTEGTHQIQRGLGQLYEGAFGSGLAGDTGKFAAGLGNVGFGALGAGFAPLSALYRSVIGQPLEDVTGIPREYTETVAQLATPGIGFTKLGPGATLPKTPFTREIPLTPPPGAPPPGPMIRPVDVEQPRVAQAAVDLQAYNPDVRIPRAVTGGPTEQQRGQQLSNLPYAGVPLIESVKTTVPKTLEQTRDIAAAEFGTGDTVNVGERVGANLREQAAAEKAAADAAAEAANAKAKADWEAANARTTAELDAARAKATADLEAGTAAREASIAAPEQQALQAAERTTAATQAAVGPDLPVRAMSRGNIDRTRIAHDSLEARKNALYDEAGNLNARISDRANVGVHGFVERSLEHAGIHTQEVEGIRGSRSMLRMLDRYAEAARAREPLAPVGQSMQEVEQLRKNLNLARGTAENPTDERIATHIMNALDDWQARATEHHLMPGSDPRALPAFLDARTTNRELMEKFGYNKHDDADKLINKIVRGEVDQHTGENEIATALTDSGDKGPLFHRKLMEATNHDPDVVQSIRSGTWNRLTRNDRGEPLSAKEVQKNVTAYLTGKNRALAEQVFTADQRALMRRHADTVVAAETQQEAAAAARKLATKETEAARRLTTQEAKAARKAATKEEQAAAPKEIKAEPGDIQKLVEASIGGKRDEAVFELLHGYAREGGDIAKLNRLVNQLPKDLQGDLAGAVIRGLGKSPTHKGFSLDLFSNQWKDLTPAAKKVMFRHADPSHIKALDDIAIVSDRMRQVQSKFGNRAGTAQNTLAGLILGAVGSQIFTHPKAALTTAAGIGATAVSGRYLANLMNTPAGASSIRKYAQAVEQAEKLQSPAHMAAVKVTQRNLANTARALAATQNLTRK